MFGLQLLDSTEKNNFKTTETEEKGHYGQYKELVKQKVLIIALVGNQPSIIQSPDSTRLFIANELIKQQKCFQVDTTRIKQVPDALENIIISIHVQNGF